MRSRTDKHIESLAGGSGQPHRVLIAIRSDSLVGCPLGPVGSLVLASIGGCPLFCV
jgi:hypothetical protein